MFHSLRQVLVLLACAGLLGALVGQLNHALAPLAVTVAVPGLLLSFAALRLPLRTGLAVACLAGLWIDAAAPVGFGRHALFFGIAFCALHQVRSRLPRQETLIGVVAALFINLALFVLFALLDLGALPDPASSGLRLLLELLVSQLFTALIGPWFLALQGGALRLASAQPETTVGRFA